MISKTAIAALRIPAAMPEVQSQMLSSRSDTSCSSTSSAIPNCSLTIEPAAPDAKRDRSRHGAVPPAEAEGKLLRIPTGDGGALVFHTNPEAPVLCAHGNRGELKKHPELQVRMGIHSGPVSEVTDVNEPANIAGAGINMAQRVMDCGDAGHILLSQHVADDLVQYRAVATVLHDLGEIEVKHGVRVQSSIFTPRNWQSASAKKFQAGKKQSAQVRWAEMTDSSAGRSPRHLSWRRFFFLARATSRRRHRREKHRRACHSKI